MTTTKNYNKTIAERLFSCRTKKGMTTKEFSSFLGVSYRSYMNYENGLGKPTLSNLISICNKLGVSISSMIGR